MIKIIDSEYIHSTPGYLKQGVKGLRTPKGAVAGGNGSFVMQGNSPQIYLYYNEDGKQSHANIYPLVKQFSNRKVTEKYALEICSTLMDKEFNSMDDVTRAILAQLK